MTKTVQRKQYAGSLEDISVNASGPAAVRNLFICQKCPFPILNSSLRFSARVVHCTLAWLENYLDIGGVKAFYPSRAVDPPSPRVTLKQIGS
jgi:hypothetical protein